MFNDFDEKEQGLVQAQKKKKQQQKKLLLILLLLAAGAYFYFMVYLLEEKIKALEAELQGQLDRVKNAKQDDCPEMLATLSTYQQWANGTSEQQTALANKQTELNEAVKWLQENQKTEEQLKKELEAKFLEKGRIWELPPQSWADVEVKKIATTLVKHYQEDAKAFPGGDGNEQFYFSRAASYNIHFPPALKEFYEQGKSMGQNNCSMLDEEEHLNLSDEIKAWIRKVENNPIRLTSSERDNNAIFYGAPGTGKTATVKNICFKANKYPMIEVKGSALTPRKQDQDTGILPLEKFCYTISELEWKLDSIYGFERESNGEVRYILFVDEADQISNNSLIHEPNRLRFLKECMEGIDKKRRSNNLWIFATNHLKDIEEAVYRKGRLSNPLDFSWTWGEFLKNFDDIIRNPQQYDLSLTYSVPQIPERWQEEKTLQPEDDKWVKRFNIDTFKKDFLGEDEDNPSKPKFWKEFIEKNPDAKYETEEDEIDDQGNPTGQKEKVEIEIGEFLQFFWNLKDGGQLMNYDGSFETPRNPNVEEVLDSNLPTMSQIIAESSNALGASLENLTKEVEAIRQHIQSSGSNQNSHIYSEIQALRQSLADLQQEVYRRNY